MIRSQLPTNVIKYQWIYGRNLLYQSLSLFALGSSEALEDSREECRSPPSPDRQSVMQHRANTTMHVCWHRSTSIGMKDHCIVFEVCTHVQISTSP